MKLAHQTKCWSFEKSRAVMRILKTVFRLGSADFTNKWKNWSQPEIIAGDNRRIIQNIDCNQLI